MVVDAPARLSCVEGHLPAGRMEVWRQEKGVRTWDLS